MQIYTQIQQNSYVVALSGSINPENVTVVQDVLLEALELKPKEVMVDCEELEDISPKSLKSFISTVRSLQRNKIDFMLISVNEKLHNTFSSEGVTSYTYNINSTSLIADKGQCDILIKKL